MKPTCKKATKTNIQNQPRKKIEILIDAPEEIRKNLIKSISTNLDPRFKTFGFTDCDLLKVELRQNCVACRIMML